MSRFHIEILVTPRPGILDPEGKAIHHALGSLGYEEVADVRVGKAVYLELDAGSGEDARERADEMCRKLLANPVTEDYEISLLDRAPAGVGSGGPGGSGGSGGSDGSDGSAADPVVDGERDPGETGEDGGSEGLDAGEGAP